MEFLVKAVDASHADANQDRAGSYKRGMIVLAKPDGWAWGALEGLPRFAIIKVPTISVASAEKYLANQMDEFFPEQVYRRRLWIIRWASLPLAARNTLANTGVLTIKAGSYSGTFDYTWAQVKQYFRNQLTGLDETEDI